MLSIYFNLLYFLFISFTLRHKKIYFYTSENDFLPVFHQLMKKSYRIYNFNINQLTAKSFEKIFIIFYEFILNQALFSSIYPRR